ncbi:hypothetical protein Tsubulata_049088 [Turnera subulata]|uniref:DUF4283 domain-containing protein n=1 Tax=Turnera subulata TaxID=218843 RepID=A0A9Q0GLH1_9ROSI|nr:hypothetical protein Tsubulata_049088 [Turnera subulata]
MHDLADVQPNTFDLGKMRERVLASYGTTHLKNGAGRKAGIKQRLWSECKDESDLVYVVANTPWSVANAHLVVKEWPAYMTFEQVDLSLSVLWVHVHGLPLTQLNANNATHIGNLFEGMKDFEAEAKNALNASGLLRVKVKLAINKPLLTGFTNIINEDWQPWVRFKYEGLTECCFFRGRLGHSLPRCWFKGEDDKPAEFEEQEMDYRPWLQGSIPPHRMYIFDPP